MNIRRVSFSSINDSLQRDMDVLICCSSFEDRCKSVPLKIPPERITKAYIFKNVEFNVHVEKNCQELKGHFGEKCDVKLLEHLRPVVTADSLSACLIECIQNGMESFLIDITTFTHESLLMLLKLFQIHLNSNHYVILTYSSAAYYGGDATTDNKDRWLSKGIREVRTVLGYSGQFLPSNRLHLVIIVGYEHERASGLIEILEPAGISLGYGKSGSSTDEKDDVANIFYHKLVKDTATTFGSVRNFEINCNDPLETKNVLLKLLEEIDMKRTNVILAPMNNKLSTIGAALAAMQKPEIQICYAPVHHYNVEKYSTPGSGCYLLELPELFE